MEAIVLQVFVSFVLASVSLLFFVISAKQGDNAHADRLALLPIEPERSAASERAERRRPRAPPPNF